jgi:hypothetical protein
VRIDNGFLKTWYCQERKKLEEMPLFEREAALLLCQTKEKIVKKIKEEITPESLQKKFPYKHLEFLFNDTSNKTSFKMNLEAEFEARQNNITDSEYRNARTLHRVKIPEGQDIPAYAKYFFQLELVNKIEDELTERGIDPQEIYIQPAVTPGVKAATQENKNVNTNQDELIVEG